MEIDMTDFAILRCIKAEEKPPWKNRIHECLMEQGREEVSVQTVGRRVDRLHDAGLLKSCIISPDNINRDLIIAFKLTDTGKNTLRQKRRETLLDAVHEEMFGEEQETVENGMLYELVEDEFGLDASEETPLRSYGRNEILTLIALYYAVKRAENTFTEENVGKVVELVRENEEGDNILSQDFFSGAK